MNKQEEKIKIPYLFFMRKLGERDDRAGDQCETALVSLSELNFHIIWIKMTRKET